MAFEQLQKLGPTYLNLPIETRMTKLTDICCRPTRPHLCLEVNPPKGTDLEPIFARLEGKLDAVDFLNVTDCALAKMKMAALPFASILKQRYGTDAMVNVSCRDRNVLALQADLLAAWCLGIRSVVALTGDAMTVGDTPERKGVFEVNSVGLLHIIAELNAGRDLAGHALKGSTSFVPGVVVNPNVKNAGAELKRLQKKKDAGARYALSQPVFEVEAATNFFRDAVEVGVPLFVGLLPLKSATAAHAINRIPGIRVPQTLLDRLDKLDEKRVPDFFIQHCVELAQSVQPYVAGFHVVSGATPLLALQLAQALARHIDYSVQV